MSGRPWEPPQPVRDLIEDCFTDDEHAVFRLQDVHTSSAAADLLYQIAGRLQEISLKLSFAASLLSTNDN